MIIDNFDLIAKQIDIKETDNKFLHCQIVCRAKDHKNEKVKEGAIHTYFIRSKEHLMSLKNEIMMLCALYGARCYINLGAKSFKKLQKLNLKLLMDDVLNENTRNPRKCLNSAAGELKQEIPHWIVDIDNIEDKEKVVKWLDEYDINHDNKGWLYCEVPTKSCCHLIVTPFNLKAFSDAFPTIDVHKNSMGTMLFCPEFKN